MAGSDGPLFKFCPRLIPPAGAAPRPPGSNSEGTPRGIYRRDGTPTLYRADRDVLEPPGLVKITDHVWRDERLESREPPAPLAEGSAVFSTWVRRSLRYYVFVGAQVGEPAAVRNPFNFDAEDRNRIAGPINFPTQLDTTGRKVPGAFGREDRDLHFFGLAYQPNDAAFVSASFDGDRPDRHRVGIAQAQVFNNHSWDLWTQMWHAQLAPVDRYDAWLERLERSETPALSNELGPVRAYLRGTQALVETMSARPADSAEDR